MAAECTCGYGGFHDPDNPRCELNQRPALAPFNDDYAVESGDGTTWEPITSTRDFKVALVAWFRQQDNPQVDQTRITFIREES